MPLVLVKRNPKVITDDILRGRIIDFLPNFVASSLTCDNRYGKLTPNDIEIIVSDFGPFDKIEHDLMIIVWANSYPERLKNLKARKRMLRKQLESVLSPLIKGYVWILLQDGSFGEFWDHRGG
ncbi:MAG TPA: hypothetical protein PLD14_02625 [Candidatus Pacearchaeota archaeon]|nr:hypothetical protein [Candidatus Pacearchaeota archaeon]HPR80096.1 hypothetical protein [Candidatus Pacearchaeota archaeon]